MIMIRIHISASRRKLVSSHGVRGFIMTTQLRKQLSSASRRAAGILALLLAAAGTAQSQPTVLEVIPLRYRSAQEIIPVIQPLLPRGGSVSGLQGQLVVRTTPANLDEIKRILATIDVAPRQLMITVRQDADTARRQSRAEISGEMG